MHDERDTPSQGTETRPEDQSLVPSCACCLSTNTRIIHRVDYALYVRCDDCAYVWGVPQDPTSLHPTLADR